MMEYIKDAANMLPDGYKLEVISDGVKVIHDSRVVVYCIVPWVIIEACYINPIIEAIFNMERLM